MTDTDAPLSRAQTIAGIVPVWLLAAVGAIIAGVWVPPVERFGALGLSLAVCALVAFCLQLATRRRDGFVSRVVTGIVGAVLVTAVAGIVFALLP